MKLLGFDLSPECHTKTSKEETLLLETVGEDNSLYFGIPLQGSWATGGVILKKTVTMKPALNPSLVCEKNLPL